MEQRIDVYLNGDAGEVPRAPMPEAPPVLLQIRRPERLRPMSLAALISEAAPPQRYRRRMPQVHVHSLQLTEFIENLRPIVGIGLGRNGNAKVPVESEDVASELLRHFCVVALQLMQQPRVGGIHQLVLPRRGEGPHIQIVVWQLKTAALCSESSSR